MNWLTCLLRDETNNRNRLGTGEKRVYGVKMSLSRRNIPNVKFLEGNILLNISRVLSEEDTIMF